MRKFMMVGCAVAVATSAILSVQGGVICSAESVPVAIDSRIEPLVFIGGM